MMFPRAVAHQRWYTRYNHRSQVGLSSEAIQGASLPLEGIHNIHGSDGLPLGMLGVGDCVPDDILQENLENTPGLLVDKPTDTFDATPPCKSPDSRLGDTLDVVPQDLAMPLGTSLAQAFASFSSSSHGRWFQMQALYMKQIIAH